VLSKMQVIYQPHLTPEFGCITWRTSSGKIRAVTSNTEKRVILTPLPADN
jgi:hypothetical protein